MKKLAFIVWRRVEASEAYEGKTNRDVEKEILEKILVIPYVAKVVKVTLL